MKAAEIAARLALSADMVAAMLLPNGKRVGPEYECGSISGEAGQSLKVRLTGPKAGTWKDFASDEGGDLLDLWAQARGISIAEAMTQAREFLGVRPVAFHQERRAPTIKAPKASPVKGPVLAWLTTERGLSEEACRAYRLAEKDGELLMPAFTPNGKLQFAKYRSIREKRFHSEPGGKSCLFGWQAIPPDAREVAITEGELDAVAWFQSGVPALSVTNGAGSMDWLEVEFDRLDRFDRIYISFDMDDAGQKNVEAIAERLGRERCFVVKLPAKDANECLLKGYDLKKSLQSAATLDPPELRRVDSYRDEVERLFDGGALKRGVTLPWGDYGFAFGPGELTIISGATGHGKSEISNLLTLHAMRSGLRACVASLEFHPAKWIRNAARQAGGRADMAKPFLHSVLDWMDDRCWLFGKRGTVNADRLIEVFAYAAQRYGCRWFVVDNLAKCGLSEDDYPAQKDLADRLGDFANDHLSHVILVAHTNKGASGIASVKGSGGLTDMADNVFHVWRNREQEERARIADNAGELFAPDGPDAVFKAWKVRDGETEPRIGLSWDATSHQHVPFRGASPIRFVTGIAEMRKTA